MSATPDKNAIRYLEEHARLTPERVALRWVTPASLERWDGEMATPLEYDQISYASLAAGVRSAARGLQKMGLTQGERVLIFLPMGLAMYTAMFAVQRLGAIAVFVDSWARRHQLRAIIACSQPRAMISQAAAFDLLTDLPESGVIRLRLEGPAFAELCRSPAEAGPAAAVEEESPALITFTTGSSGGPKGASRTHRFLGAQHRALARILPYGADDRDLPAFPIFSLNNLASGVTTILPAINLAQPGDRDGALLTHQILQQEVTCATLSVAMLNGVSRHCANGGIQLRSLRRAVTGGAPVSRAEVRAFAAIAPCAEIVVLYGSTEVEPIAHIEAKEMLAAKADDEDEGEGVNVGRISPGLRHKFIRISKDPVEFPAAGWAQLEVGAGEVGELVVEGDHVCGDYYNNPDAFRRAKIVDDQSRIWHRTGDLARLDDDGCLWLVGRVHNVILRDGRSCFPVQSEVLLKSFPFVRQAAYLGLADAQHGERAAAVVALDPASRVNAADALTQIQPAFTAHHLPLDSFFVVEHIPMDPRHHSKVEYAALRDLLRATQAKDWIA